LEVVGNEDGNNGMEFLELNQGLSWNGLERELEDIGDKFRVRIELVLKRESKWKSNDYGNLGGVEVSWNSEWRMSLIENRMRLKMNWKWLLG
jgi:hypothetical protein